RFGHGNYDLLVLLNTGSGWREALENQCPFGGAPIDYYHLQDVNRDGLPDLVMAPRLGVSGTTIMGALNVGLDAGQTNVWEQMAISDGPDSDVARPPSYGDIDGDGIFDAFAEHDLAHLVTTPPPRVYMGTGAGFALQGDVVPPLIPYNVPFLNHIEMVDINADGL